MSLKRASPSLFYTFGRINCWFNGNFLQSRFSLLYVASWSHDHPFLMEHLLINLSLVLFLHLDLLINFVLLLSLDPILNLELLHHLECLHNLNNWIVFRIHSPTLIFHMANLNLPHKFQLLLHSIHHHLSWPMSGLKTNSNPKSVGNTQKSPQIMLTGPSTSTSDLGSWFQI